MQTRKGFGWWQWETLLVTMGGHALCYIIRKHGPKAYYGQGEDK